MIALPSCPSGYRWRDPRPNEVLAQRLEERQYAGPVIRPAQANPQAGVVLPGGADRTKMFHVKHFGTIGAKNLTRRKTAASPDLVRSIDFLVQLASGAAAASMA
jgi:hypothetical protein